MSLNKLYSTPLHGVELFNSTNKSCSTISSCLPFKLEIDENKLPVNANNKLIWSLTDSGKNYQTQLNLFQISANEYILDVACEGKGRFYISPDKISIDWVEGTDSTHYFQTLAIAFWLELNNVLCIHANALVKDNKAIAIIGPSGMGKTTLSAYLQDQGYTWLTDDMLAIHQPSCRSRERGNPQTIASFPRSHLSSPRRQGSPNDNVIPADVGISKQTNYQIYPSWPNARMWPDSVQRVTNIDTNSLNKVHNNFSKLSMPIKASSPLQSYELSAIYTLNRHGAKLAIHKKNTLIKQQLKQQKNMQKDVKKDMRAQAKEIKEVSVIPMQSSQAIITLVQNSMLGSAYATLIKQGKSLEQTRLASCVSLLNMLPIKQIEYPNSFNSLSAIKNLIESDIQIHA